MIVSGILLPHFVGDFRAAETVYDCFGDIVTGRHVDAPEGGGHEEEE